MDYSVKVIMQAGSLRLDTRRMPYQIRHLLEARPANN
jgi:hypothetical protein